MDLLKKLGKEIFQIKTLDKREITRDYITEAFNKVGEKLHILFERGSKK